MAQVSGQSCGHAARTVVVAGFSSIVVMAAIVMQPQPPDLACSANFRALRAHIRAIDQCERRRSLARSRPAGDTCAGGPMGCVVVLTFGRTDDVTTRLDRWKDLIRENFVALDIAADRDTAFAGGVRSSLLAHLEVSDVRSITQDAIRPRGLARCDDTSYLQVGLVTEGTAVLRQDGRECVLRPGDFALYATSRPFAWGLRASWRLCV